MVCLADIWHANYTKHIRLHHKLHHTSRGKHSTRDNIPAVQRSGLNHISYRGHIIICNMGGWMTFTGQYPILNKPLISCCYSGYLINQTSPRIYTMQNRTGGGAIGRWAVSPGDGGVAHWGRVGVATNGKEKHREVERIFIGATAFPLDPL